MRISDWSSDVCSSDLPYGSYPRRLGPGAWACAYQRRALCGEGRSIVAGEAKAGSCSASPDHVKRGSLILVCVTLPTNKFPITGRSEKHTSELKSLMRISSAVFCLTKKRILNSKIHTS